MEHEKMIWDAFAHKNNLLPEHIVKFQQYYELLIQANELFNITTITDLKSVLAYHFEDSLKLGAFLDLQNITSMCDIGTGGGFPGIPLKIVYPHISVVLLEVSQKKVSFLQRVIDTLGLQGIETCDLDWRTFLRKTDGDIELFCARASLHPDELIRMFAGSSSYKKGTLVYWASHEWQPTVREKPYFKRYHEYRVGDRNRKYCIFSL